MKNEVMNKVGEYIDALAKNLGVAAEHVYKVLVQQQLAEGIGGLLVSLLINIVCILVLSKLVKVYRNAEYREIEFGFSMKKVPQNKQAEFVYMGDGVPFWVFGILSIIVLGIMIPIAHDFVLRLINPEYYAIKEIMDVFKGD